LLALAVVCAVVLRWPLVTAAPVHLDSDLAVDGLVLREALRGELRWHYPGTPHMGILPVLLSLPQASVMGATPATLVSGGVLAHALIVVVVFSLAWRVHGAGVAAWSLLPLALTSTGLVWLSSRITGGHLLAVAWAAWVLIALDAVLRWASPGRCAWLGLAAGLGVYLDRMLMPVAGLAGLALVLELVRSQDPPRRRAAALAGFALALGVGYLPAWLGQRLDPYDAYGDQFATVFRVDRADGTTAPAPAAQVRSQLGGHARILVADCLPRLFAGHRLPGLQADPHPQSLAGGPPPPDRPTPSLVGLVTTLVGLTLATLGFFALATAPGPAPPAQRRRARVARAVLLVLGVAVVVAFVINRHIYNSDNYRYLVLLVIPWALGVGLLLDAAWRRGGGLRVLGVALATAYAGLILLDTHAWYDRLGWLDGVVPARPAGNDPALAWLGEHPEVLAVFGDYWDVYRLAFLAGGTLQGVPYPVYPDRFPAWSARWPGRRPRVMLVRPWGPGPDFARRALAAGATERHRARNLLVLDWPPEPAADGR
jgi:hypothetical protein